jgi:hypothetical protein
MIPILKNTINRIDAQYYTILNLRKTGRMNVNRVIISGSIIIKGTHLPEKSLHTGNHLLPTKKKYEYKI